MPYFFSNDLQMFYQTKGEGIPTVFIHGLGSNHKIWMNQINSLSQDLYILAADSRYHGLSTVNGEVFKGYTIEYLARDWIGLLRSKADRKAYLVGLSMGSAVAMQITLECPELVSGLILIEPWASCDDEHRSRLESWIDMMERDQDLNRFNETLIRHYFSKSFIENFPERVRTYANIRSEQGLSVDIQDCHACLAFDIRKRLNEIEVPTALIYGEFDVLIPPYHSRLLKREMPRAFEVRFKDCGHMPLIECPEEFNHLIRKCVESFERGAVPQSLQYQELLLCDLGSPGQTG
jgi:3-oxoadipate enol-lactonase